MARTTGTTHVERLPLTLARVNLGAVVKRVHLGKVRIILEKDGIPIAGLIDISEFEDFLELVDPKANAAIRQSKAQYLAGKSRPARALLAELKKASNGRRAARTRSAKR